MTKQDLRLIRRLFRSRLKADRNNMARAEKLARRRNTKREIEDPEGFFSEATKGGWIS